MPSLRTIFTIALFEGKTLRRSWFFRIFLISSLLVFFFIDLVFFTYTGDGIWFLRAIPSSIPYINLLYLNIAQAVVAVFLSADLLKKDNKMDTTEVIYAMPVSNSEYILGKVLGNIIAFTLVNFILLLMAFVYNMIAPQMGFQPVAYLYYFLLIPIPSLIFITGLSFLVMIIIRNQAVTFLILLGLLGVSLFYIKGDHCYIFDQFALYLPMISSDITGFDNPLVSVGQRLMYFFLGMSLIILTIGLFKRLPRRGNRTITPLILSLLFFLLAFITGLIYTNSIRSGKKYREHLIALNNQYSGCVNIYPAEYNIGIKHTKNTIQGNCLLKVVNNDSIDVSTIVFRLNPGLIVSEVSFNNKPLHFIRKEHLIVIENELHIHQGDSALFHFSYSGSINEKAMYLDVEEERRLYSTPEFFKGGIRTAYLTPEYTLLTPEADWYPNVGVSYSTNNSGWYRKWFSRFTLEVETTQGLTPVSQGQVIQREKKYIYSPEYRIPAITLVIGEFVHKSFVQDSLTFSLFMKPGHCYFENAFNKLSADTVETIFRNRFADYSRKVMLDYPFRRMTIVEVPLHFDSFQRPWSGSLENTQPEILLVQEKAALVDNADFKRTMNNIKRWGRYSDEGSLNETEIEIKAIDRFFESFTKTTVTDNSNDGNNEVENKNNPNNLFPMFYDSRFYLESSKYPILDRCFQSYFKNLGKQTYYNTSTNTRLTDSERANKKLKNSSFAELLTSRQEIAMLDRIISMKGDVLFSIIQSKSGELAFKNIVTDIINKNNFESYRFDQLSELIEKKYGIQLDEYLNDWYNGKQIPGYQTSNVLAEKVKDEDRLRTNITFRIRNTTNHDGIIRAIFVLADKNNENRSNNDPETYTKTVIVKANQVKEVSTILYKEPRSLLINTLISENIPSVITIPFSNIKESPGKKPIDGETIIKDLNSDDLDIIIDNEDSLFQSIQPSTSGLLPVFLDNFRESNEDEYNWFRWWRAPVNWKKTIGSSYYGKNILSVHYCRSGNGDRKAIWKANIKESGFYEVYYHAFVPNEDYIKENIAGEYLFSIYHDDGVDSPSLELSTSESGWVHLGTYYFSSGSTPRVELTNKTTAKMVIADAVKFSKIND